MNITGKTMTMGMVGDPIEQITTPNAINSVFERNGVDIICVPHHVRKDRLSHAWLGFRANSSLAGLGITIPHKEEAAQMCDRLLPNAVKMGIVNAVRRETDGTMTGENFDGLGFVGGLAAKGHSVEGRAVRLLGAGAAAKAIAFTLVDEGAVRVTISNRTVAKAEALADAVNTISGSEIVDTSVSAPDDYDIVINCTALGMKDNDPLPIGANELCADQLVAEVVAKPEQTPLLKQANAIGCRTHVGLEMIKFQVELIARFIIERGPSLEGVS